MRQPGGAMGFMFLRLSSTRHHKWETQHERVTIIEGNAQRLINTLIARPCDVL